MAAQKPRFQTAWLGRIPFEQAWQLQRQLAADIASGRQPPTLLLLEHSHTFTLGRSGSWKNLLWSQDTIINRGAATLEVDRGGDITYHGPGQLVGYPLLPLGQVDARGRLPGPDYHRYLRNLEQLLIEVLHHWDLPANVVDGLTGVWLTEQASNGQPPQLPAKIGAIGVKVDAQGISQHGFALNVDPDMSYFKGIIPCGITDHPVTSMAHCCKLVPAMAEVRHQAILQFQEVFECELKMVTPESLGLSTDI